MLSYLKFKITYNYKDVFFFLETFVHCKILKIIIILNVSDHILTWYCLFTTTNYLLLKSRIIIHNSVIWLIISIIIII